MAVSSVLGDLIVRVSGEPLDDGIGYRFSGLFFYMKFVSSASPTTHLFSSTAHTPPLYELGQMDISCTTYYLRSHYNNLCIAKMGSVQRSVATSHQTDYPGRTTPICSLILPTDQRHANSDKVPFQFPLQFLLVI